MYLNVWHTETDKGQVAEERRLEGGREGKGKMKRKKEFSLIILGNKILGRDS